MFLCYRCVFDSVHGDADNSWSTSDVYGALVRSVRGAGPGRRLQPVLSTVPRPRLRHGHRLQHRHALLQLDHSLDHILHGGVLCEYLLSVTVAEL